MDLSTAPALGPIALALLGCDAFVMIVFYGLWRRERAPWLGLWALSFGALGISHLGILPTLIGRASPALSLLGVVMVQCAALLVVAGTYRFLARRFSLLWVVAPVASLVISAVLAVSGASVFLISALPTLILSGAYVVTGVHVLRTQGPWRGMGQRLTGAVFIALGLHFLDFPVMANEAWFAPYGFVIGFLGEVAIALGLALMHIDAASAAATATERRTRDLVENATIGIFSADAQGQVLSVNPSLARLLGASAPTDLLGKPLIAPSSSPSWSELVSAAGQSLEVSWRRADDTALLASVSVRAVKSGSALTYDGFVVDLTHARELEAQLRQAQKQEAIGRLAGGIAHDFNNLLTVVQASLSFVEKAPGLSAEERGALDDAKRSAEKGARLTKQLLSVSRRHSNRPEVVDVGATARDVLQLLGRTLGTKVHLDGAAIEDARWTLVDRSQLEQVLLNLVLNARDAMPEGGVIRVGVSSLEDRAGRWVRLWVEDTGAGIRPEDLPRIFEPFFTTKGPGRGTGLGLATVHGIVSQCGGTVGVTSAPGHGTCFDLRLPMAEAPSASPERTAVAAPARQLRVLIVDDEPAIRRILHRTLSRAGYEVLEADSGKAAEAVGAKEPLDLLVTDVLMADGNGLEAATELRLHQPTLRVLFISGYSDSVAAARTLSSEAVHFLAKPFTPEQLLSAVAELSPTAPQRAPPNQERAAMA